MRRRRVVGVLVLGLVGLGPVTTGAASGPTPTATVSDSTDLVDGQPIVVRGQGWNPEASVTVLLCADLDDDDHCESLGHSHRPGPAGRFTIRTEIEIVLDLHDRSVDCRVHPCLLSVWSETHGFPPVEDPPPVVIPVTFDPEGPAPPRHEADVSPTTGLVDGSHLRIEGDGFSPGGQVSIVPCRAPAAANVDCDGLAARSARSTAGHVETSFWMPAVLDLAPWWDDEPVPVDCRVEECVLLVVLGYWEEGGELSQAAFVPLDFQPGAPLRAPPSATVVPATGLADGDRVTVDASGLNGGGPTTIRQCAGPLNWEGVPHRCRAVPPVRVVAREDGTLHRRVRISSTVVNEAGRRWSCRTRPCWLVVEQRYERPAARARLRFSP